jgi:hypothetical protein
VIWVLIFVAIALGGVIMVTCYAVWLAHKTSDVLSEFAMLADRAGELAELVGQVGVPAGSGHSRDVDHGRFVADGLRDEAWT